MIYGYLSDTALAPLGAKNTTYQSYSTNGIGVCQLTERVMSMFNTDMDIDDSEDTSPGLIIDPRSNRLRGTFSGTEGADSVRPSGAMSLHYDRYLTYQAYKLDPTTVNDLIDQVTEEAELKLLFSVIETIVMSHEYDSDAGVWSYLSSSALNAKLRYYSTEDKGSYGYRMNSLIISTVDTDNDKVARVQNIVDGTTVDTIGTDADAKTANVVFPDYVSFKFRFSRFDDDTIFTLYLNPQAITTAYPTSTITHVVMPLDPAVLCNTDLDVDAVAIATIDMTSAYVADMISNEVYKGDILQGTNYTGSVAKPLTYRETTNSVKFACIYRGKTPDTQTCLKAIYDALFKRLTTLPENPMTEEQADEAIQETFPSILSSSTFVIVPFYDSYVESDLNHSYSYSRNVLDLAYIRSVVKDIVGSSTTFDAYTTMIGIPGYDMHAVAIAEIDTDGATVAPISAHGLDSVEAFQCYQALSSVDSNWITMTPEAQKLANYLAVLVGAELINSIIPPTLAYVNDSRQYGTITCPGYSFTIGSATFFVMKKVGYTKLVEQYQPGA